MKLAYNEIMRILNLIRHAKSSHDLDLEDDFDRPLTDRGRADAKSLDDHLNAYNFPKHTIICSNSIRTRETYNCLECSLNSNSDVFYLDELYLANYREIIKLIKVYKKSNMLTVIGHNTGISDLLSFILGDFKLPDMATSSIAQIEVPKKNTLIEEGSGKVVLYLRSKENKIKNLLKAT